jgi:hypothetical protein
MAKKDTSKTTFQFNGRAVPLSELTVQPGVRLQSLGKFTILRQIGNFVLVKRAGAQMLIGQWERHSMPTAYVIVRLEPTFIVMLGTMLLWREPAMNWKSVLDQMTAVLGNLAAGMDLTAAQAAAEADVVHILTKPKQTPLLLVE